jgi:transposase InsO family protein
MGVNRSHLSSRVNNEKRPRGSYSKEGDVVLVERIKQLMQERPTFGYRRVAAMLSNEKPVNHKRAYRVMKQAGLLLPRHTGLPPRPHDGKIITLRSDTRWCSDSFEIRCWNGERVEVAFSLDCCDREAISYVATMGHLTGELVRDLMAQSVEARFGAGALRTPHALEWLTDNGAPYTAHETRRFAGMAGLLVRNTPAYSPESNGMAEAFVKTFKRDFVYLAKLPDAATVLQQLPAWFDDYNNVHPHKGLKMLSPRKFRLTQLAL